MARTKHRNNAEVLQKYFGVPTPEFTPLDIANAHEPRKWFRANALAAWQNNNHPVAQLAGIHGTLAPSNGEESLLEESRTNWPRHNRYWVSHEINNAKE